tara:strand:- start:86 stop:709 length:624 start_codon:yes stop_codon:yes gene_type:complete
LRIDKKNKRFIYLISPNYIKNNDFYEKLKQILSSNKVNFFQLRLKKEKRKKKIIIAKKIKKICKKYKVKFIINDDPLLTKKINADGCHLGQKDMNILEARKILKNKIIGITCHNSVRLARRAISNGANYLAFGSFYSSKTKKVRHTARLKTLSLAKEITKIPIVAIGGIKDTNYKKLLLNKANFLAISDYIWNNKKLNPREAINKLV